MPGMLSRQGMLAAIVAALAAGGCRDVRPAAVDGAAADAEVGDAASDAPRGDGGGSGDGDGAVTRVPCVGAFDAGLTAGTFGRLDGFLVAIVPPTGNPACRADNDHLHLQVRAQGKTYDIAINISSDVHSAAIDRAAFSPWSEGWHYTGDGSGGNVFVDYPGLGLHSNTIPLSTPAALVSAMTADLATVNHISIYATSYSTSDGAHLVHYNGTARDGMIVTKPLSPTARMRAFSFDSQSF